MRRFAAILGIALVAGLTIHQQPAKAAARTRLYLAFVSHNEDSNNVLCQPVNTNQIRYIANRAALLQVAQTIYAGGGAYDMMSDWEWLFRTSQWETDDDRSA
jgi:hypothetical protein